VSATAIKERPILMSAPMVRAILEGRKTQTRRAMKPQPEHNRNRKLQWSWKNRKWRDGYTPHDTCPHCSSWHDENPYGKPGDRLWVRETWFEYQRPHRAGYAANQKIGRGGRKRSSIYMPRWASRITLEITEVRVERIQDISEEGAIAEGTCIVEPDEASSHMNFYFPTVAKDKIRCGSGTLGNARECFEHAVRNLGHMDWDANPWVWVVSFRRVES
jgi:hypothetical protein